MNTTKTQTDKATARSVTLFNHVKSRELTFRTGIAGVDERDLRVSYANAFEAVNSLNALKAFVQDVAKNSHICGHVGQIGKQAESLLKSLL